MQKSWYILYVRRGFEKKVSTYLTKRKFENFYPVNTWKEFGKYTSKTIREVLFPSFVFVRAGKDQINILRTLEYVIGLVHWKERPAIIPEQEISALREFIKINRKITTQKIEVGFQEEKNKHLQSSFFVSSEKVLLVKSGIIKINLPSIGFSMLTQTDNAWAIISEEILKSEQSVMLQ